MQTTVAVATLAGLVCLSVVGGFVFQEVAKLDAGIAMVLANHRKQLRSKSMQEAVEVVVTQSGRTVTIRTVRNDGESAKAWGIRHNEAIAEALTW